MREVSNARHKKTQKKSLQFFNYALFISVQGCYNFFMLHENLLYDVSSKGGSLKA